MQRQETLLPEPNHTPGQIVSDNHRSFFEYFESNH